MSRKQAPPLPFEQYRRAAAIALAGCSVCLVCATLWAPAALAVDKAPKSAAKTAAKKEAAADNDAKEEFRAAKKDIQTRLRNKQVFERITALRDAGKYPTPDAAKLIVSVGLKDDAPEVRSAAYDTLLDFKDNAEVARYLLVTVGKETRRGSIGPNALPMLAVLLASSLPDVEHDVTAYLEKQANGHDGPVVVAALADELGGHGQPDDVTQLAKLAKLSAFDREFGLRRSVVQALIKIGSTPAVGQLIAILEKVKGEIRGDIVQYLAEATGQDLGLDSAAWTQWWKDNEKTFQAPGAPVQRKDVKEFAAGRPGGRGTSMYYGLSIYAQKLVFIIDISSSMLGPRLDAAKRELLQAIDGLTEETEFSIVAFNSDVHPWQRQLVPANSQMKQAASRWVSQLQANSMTASYDALESGLRFDAEALYFLTDGEPHGGKVSAPAEIVELITRVNYSRRLSIYTIGIGVGAPGSVFDEFLSALAKQNWGVYRRVDQ
ncbi:MAG TPA: VWA domain-containing protein [Pirellulales bacterium]|nr:VWA domain-containing protein [Pirellulales bacterium]